MASGNVHIAGAPAGKSAQVEPGQQVMARGLGEFELLSVDGGTRRGNLKVSLAVRRSRG